MAITASTNTSSGDYDLAMEEHKAKLVLVHRVAADCTKWQATIAKVMRNVVGVHFCHPYAFDAEPAILGQATGFVVDVEGGHTLTNRHVFGAGLFGIHYIR